MSPWLLLGLTFALSAGDAIETPTWRAILPELVKKEDLAAASALNGIEFNFARAVGPALAGVVIAAAGVGAAFAAQRGVVLRRDCARRPLEAADPSSHDTAGDRRPARRSRPSDTCRYSPAAARHDVARRARRCFLRARCWR